MDQHDIEMKALIKAMRTAESRGLFERYEAVKLYLEGDNYSSIARKLSQGRHTVRGYVEAYLSSGIEGVKLAYYAALSRKLSSAQVVELKDVLTRLRPVDVGLGNHYSWSTNLIKAWIKREFGHTYSKGGISKLLARLGFSFTKAKFMWVSADPITDIRYSQLTSPELQLLIEGTNGGTVVYEDEDLVLPFQLLRHGWFLEGPSSRHVVRHQTQEKLSDLEGVRFLKEALRDHPDGELYAVMGHPRLEFVNDFLPYLRRNPRLSLIFLPPYAPIPELDSI